MDEMLSEAQVIAWSCALASEAVVVFLGNLLTIVLFTFNKKLRNKKSLYLVMNMAFADLVWGGACLPLFVHLVATRSRLYFTEFPTFLQIIITVSSMASTRLLPLLWYLLKDFMPFSGRWSTEHFPRENTSLLFWWLGHWLSYFLRFIDCFSAWVCELFSLSLLYIRLVTNCDYLRPQHRYLEKDSAKICSLLPKQTHANPAFDESPVITICWYTLSSWIPAIIFYLLLKIFRSKHIFKHSPFHLFYIFFQFFYQC